MRLPLNKFLEKLGVGHTLSPYETYPWFLYDEARGVTCSAEVRMGPGGDDVEAEIQFLHDEMEDGTGSREQVMWMRAVPAIPGEWTPKLLRIKGKDYVNAFHDWESKGCEFFLSCISAIQVGEMPDIDALVESKMQDDSDQAGGGRGRIGRKSPKIKTSQLLGMKKP